MKQIDNQIIIIGSGKIARAIISGLLDSFQITVIARDKQKLINIQNMDKNISIFSFDDRYDISGKNIILCVKNFALDDVSKLLNFKINCLMSVLAGVNIKTLKSKIKANHYVRVMPNIAAQFNKSYTLLSGSKDVKSLCLDIFNKIGNCVWLDNETDIDIGTAISGSGPAFLAIVAQAMIKAAVKEGMREDIAKEITNGLFDSYCEVSKHYDLKELVDMISSPSGTTVAGLKVLRHYDVDKVFIQTIQNATKRAKELSKG